MSRLDVMKKVDDVQRSKETLRRAHPPIPTGWSLPRISEGEASGTQRAKLRDERNTETKEPVVEGEDKSGDDGDDGDEVASSRGTYSPTVGTKPVGWRLPDEDPDLTSGGEESTPSPVKMITNDRGFQIPQGQAYWYNFFMALPEAEQRQINSAYGYHPRSKNPDTWAKHLKLIVYAVRPETRVSASSSRAFGKELLKDRVRHPSSATSPSNKDLGIVSTRTPSKSSRLRRSSAVTAKLLSPASELPRTGLSTARRDTNHATVSQQLKANKGKPDPDAEEDEWPRPPKKKPSGKK